MTFSEFGRRVKENASAGTDHGAAAPMFLAGSPVQSALVGAHPSLTDLEIMKVTQAGSGGGVVISRTNTNNSTNPQPALEISDQQNMTGSVSGGTRGVRINVIGTGGLSPAVRVINSGTGEALVLTQVGESEGLRIDKTSTGARDGIRITNSGSGADIRGAGWSAGPNGNSEFGNVDVGGGSAVSNGFLIFTPRNLLLTSVPAVNGRDISVTVFNTWSRIQTVNFFNAGKTVVDISRIETSNIADGTLVGFTWGDRGVGGNTAEPRFIDNNSADNIDVAGNLSMAQASYTLNQTSTFNNNIWFMKDGTEWIQVGGPSQLLNIS